ncbi:hypothetical protein KA005_04665, partial [bacterium]|nr:hypothetical protein [bacterium]
MSLAQLLKDVTAHYVSRGFPGTAIVNLHSKITDSIEGDVLKFTGTYSLEVTLNSLVGKFPLQIWESAEKLKKPQAIFGFAFGYRLKSRAAP